MTFVKPNLNDVAELLDIENEAFDKANYPLSKRAFRYHIKKNFMLTAKDNSGKILGYILIFAYLKIPRIYSVAVGKNARGKGVGKSLTAQAIKIFKNLRLEVRKDNKIAISLYEKLGFKRTKILPDYYADGQDAIAMLLDKRNDEF